MVILGVKIDNCGEREVLLRIEDFLKGDRPHLVFTPNPEMLVEAEQDWFFKQALNQADLAAADGFGLVLAAKYLYGERLSRLAGVDLMERICQMAAERGQLVYLVGGQEGVAGRAAEALKKKYPGLKVAGAERGILISPDEGEMSQRDRGVFVTTPSPLLRKEGTTTPYPLLRKEGTTTPYPLLRKEGTDNFQSPISLISNIQYLIGLDFDQSANQQLLERIRLASPDILFVAFGHAKQEKWLAEFIKELPSVKIGIGVGGAFDYFSGRVKRAPYFLRRVGLEWLWRLVVQPWRVARIWRAIWTFSFLIKDYKRQLKLPYRQGVIGFVMNQEGRFFIGKRHDSPTDYYFMHIEHWQPPQGAINKGESPEEAVVREVREETGLTTKVICRSEEKHQYDWSVAFMRKRGKGYHFRGQQKIVFLLKYEGDGSDIKLDHQELDEYKWVTLEELKQLIHPFRKKSLEILLRECCPFLPYLPR